MYEVPWKTFWNYSFFHINLFMHNAEKWSNILEKSYVVHIARFLKCVWPFFDIMHKKVKDRDDIIASVIYFSILYKLPICNLLSCCLVIVEKSTPTNLILNFFFVAPLLYLMKTTKVIPKFLGLYLRNKNKTLVNFYLEDNSYETVTE